MYVKITLEQEKEIIKLVETKSQKEIASMFNVSQSGISKLMKRYGIKASNKGRLNMARLPLDVDYFKNIDSNDKAYWLGYICGDGNINKDYKVTITTKDLEILERFKSDVKSGHTIGFTSYKDDRTNKIYTSYTIQIRNYIFVNNIIDKGVTIDKTDSLLFPKIDKKYYSYFIAGIFDSDGHVGSIGINRISLISTFEILKFISDYLYKKFDIKELKFSKVSENKDNVYKLCLYKDSGKFLKFIYGDKNFKYMSRKYNVYLDKYK